MKNLLLLLLSLIFLVQTGLGQAQSIKRDERLFENGLALRQLVRDDLSLDEIIKADSLEAVKDLARDIKETILYKAVGYYQELVDSFPKSKLLFRALNNKGFIELELKEREQAKLTFQRILESKADDKEFGGVGSGLMAEPYANYKNRAAKVLADMSIKDSNYAEAIKYLDLTKRYPYRHFCGNEHAADEVYMAELYAKSYLGLNDTQKALAVLLPYTLGNGLADNSELVALAYKTLLGLYSKNELHKMYEQAFKNYSVEKIKAKKEELIHYYITLLDTKIELDSWQLAYLTPGNEQETIEEIYKKSLLYKLLTEQE